jgi:hypothetical protein
MTSSGVGGFGSQAWLCLGHGRVRVFPNQLAGGRDATAAAAAHGQSLLHFREVRGALLQRASDLTVGNPVAHTNIHRLPCPPSLIAWFVAASYIRMRMIVNCDMA